MKGRGLRSPRQTRSFERRAQPSRTHATDRRRGAGDGPRCRSSIGASTPPSAPPGQLLSASSSVGHGPTADRVAALLNDQHAMTSAALLHLGELNNPVPTALARAFTRKPSRVQPEPGCESDCARSARRRRCGATPIRALQSRAWPRRNDRSCSGVRRRHRESDNAAGPAGLELHDYRSAAAMQSSAAPGGTAAGVALQQRRPREHAYKGRRPERTPRTLGCGRMGQSGPPRRGQWGPGCKRSPRRQSHESAMAVPQSTATAPLITLFPGRVIFEPVIRTGTGNGI